MDDQFYIKQVFSLAQKGKGRTNPNPMVGAVIVKNGKILSKGYHKKHGADHAEIMAIKNAQESLKGATIYINLEPCNHLGKTPPCTEAIIKSGITKVVCSTLDPNPKVLGKGVEKLRKNGLSVTFGIQSDKARALNNAFFTFFEKSRPFVALKFAASLDGKIATKTGDSKWISNEKSRTYATKLRGDYQAILVGINTVLKDNPNLGLRQKNRKDPLRIILDSTLKIPLSADVMRDKNVLIVTTTRADLKKEKILIDRNYKITKFDSETISIKDLMTELTKRNIISVFVEGGGSVIGSFADEKLADIVYAFQGPIIIGGSDAPSPVRGVGIEKLSDAIAFKSVEYKKFDNNILTIARA